MRELVTALLISAPFLVGASVTSDRGGEEVLRFQDPRIVESSGLAVDDDVAVTVNDSGHGPVVYTVDLASGRTVGTTTWQGEGLDIEALAPAGDGQVWVGDIGDNLALRADIEVTRVPYAAGEQAVAGESYRLTYPEGPTDAEALLTHPLSGRLYIATKDVFGGVVLEAPERLLSGVRNRMTRIGDAPAVVTDGAFFPDGRHLLLRSYSTATVMSFPALDEIATFELPRQRQGEGVAITPRGRIYLSSEGARSPLLEVDLPEGIAAKLGTVPSPTESGPSQAPDQPVENEPAEDDSAEDDSADASEFEREAWPWLAGGLLGLVAVVVLVRSLRPR